MMSRYLRSDLSGPRYATEISRELIKSNNEVFIATSYIKTKVKNAHILKLPPQFGKKSITPIAYSLYGKSTKLKYGVEIVHGNGYTLCDDVSTVHFLSRAFKKQIERFGLIEYYPKSFRISAERMIFRSSKHLIAVSSLVERDLVELYDIPKERITTIHNGVTLDEFSLSTNSDKENARVQTLKQYGFEKNKKLLLFVGGGAYKRKGFRFLLRALPYISKEVVIVAICKNISEEDRQFLSKIDVNERVKVVNYVQDISILYRAADIYVLPTIYDPFPLAVLEAMASGLPVVVSSLTGITDIIDDGKNGIIINDPSDDVELSNGINILAENDTLRKNMGLNGRATVEKLSWKNVAQKVLRVYEEVN